MGLRSGQNGNQSFGSRGGISRAREQRFESQAEGVGSRFRGCLRLEGGDGGQRWSTLLRACPRSAEALTPLHVAAAWGCSRSLELLLSQGADPRLLDQVRGPGGAEGQDLESGRKAGQRASGAPS